LFRAGTAESNGEGERRAVISRQRHAETMNPVRVRRSPLVRDTIAVLLPGTRRDAVGQELRDTAFRAGLRG
jgi:hypothetical protein